LYNFSIEKFYDSLSRLGIENKFSLRSLLGEL
jgi:hypothetical protein